MTEIKSLLHKVLFGQQSAGRGCITSLMLSSVFSSAGRRGVAACKTHLSLNIITCILCGVSVCVGSVFV